MGDLAGRQTKKCRTAVKVFASGVTALAMLCAAATPGRAEGDHIDLPLAHDFPTRLKSCAIDHGALSAKTGFQVRAPEATDNFWTTRVEVSGAGLTVTLHRPDGTLVSSKTLAARRVSCPALLDLVAVLLAAHVPGVALSAPAEAPAPASQPTESEATSLPTQVTPSAIDPESPTAVTTAASATPATSAPPVARTIEHWYAGIGGGVAGFRDGPAVLGVVRAHLQLWRYLAAGGQVLFSYSQHDVADGEAAVWTVDGRLTAGLFLRHGPLAWSVSGLVGGRLTRGAASGFDEDGSASVGSASLGLAGDIWWAAGRHLRLGVGTNVVFLLPRARFDVTGVGQAYTTPLPTVELHLSAGWEG
jgi:hypothetical protein